jgi:hypothetical protein
VNIAVAKRDETYVEFFCMPKKYPLYYVIKSDKLKYPFINGQCRKEFDSKLVTNMTKVRNKK